MATVDEDIRRALQQAVGAQTDDDAIRDALAQATQKRQRAQATRTIIEQAPPVQLFNLARQGIGALRRANSAVGAGLQSFFGPRPENPPEGMPVMQGLGMLPTDISRAWEAAKQGYQSGQDIYFKPEEMIPGAPKWRRIGAWGFGQLVQGALDPQQLVTGPAAGIAAGGVRRGVQAIKKTPLVEKRLAPVAADLADRAWNTLPGNVLRRTLGAFGFGPDRRTYEKLLQPHETELNAIATRLASRFEDMQQTVRQVMGDRNIRRQLQDYTRTTGENPLHTLVRGRILDKTTNNDRGLPQIQRMAKQFGFDPDYVERKADEFISHLDAAEMQVARFAPQRVHPKGREARVKTFVKALFGEPKSDPFGRVIKPKPSAEVPIVHEGMLRRFMDDLSAAAARGETQFIRPITEGPIPGWSAITDNRYGPLKGMQVPAPVKTWLDHQGLKSKLLSSNEVHNMYIKTKDFAEWAEKKLVGTIKRGWVGLPSTQVANVFGNNYLVKLAMEQNRVPMTQFWPNLYTAAKKIYAWQRDNVLDPAIQRFNNHSNALHGTQIVAETAGSLLEKAPSIEKLPHAWGGKFQGFAEQSYKLALFMTLEKKLGAKAAAAQADKFLFDYNNRGIMVEIAERFGLAPFSTFPIKSTELLFDTIINHPEQLAKLPRKLEIARRGENTREEYGLQDYSRKSLFTFPIGTGAEGQKEYINLQRFNPLGGPLDYLYNLQQEGFNLPTELRGLYQRSMFAPVGNVLQGVKARPREGGRIEYLAPGQPSSELGGEILGELFRQFAFAGRPIQELGAMLRGQPTTDITTAQTPKPEDFLLRYGVGLPVSSSEPRQTTQKRMKPEVKERTRTAKVYAKEVLREAKAAKQNPMRRDAEKFTDIGKLDREIQDAKARLRTLVMSGRTAQNGELDKAGKDRIRRQTFYVVALIDQKNKVGQWAKSRR